MNIINFNVKRSWYVPGDLRMVPKQIPLGIYTVTVKKLPG